jgi:hypothetical protein
LAGRTTTKIDGERPAIQARIGPADEVASGQQSPRLSNEGSPDATLNRAETGVLSAKELVTATTEARRVSSDQADSGTANRSVFLESEASMFSAQADLLRAEYDRNVAAADLARLTGNQ